MRLPACAEVRHGRIIRNIYYIFNMLYIIPAAHVLLFRISEPIENIQSPLDKSPETMNRYA